MKWYVDKKPKSCKECPCYQEIDEPITYGEPSAYGGFASGLYITHTCGIENCADMDGINNCPLIEISDSQDEINKLSKERYEYKDLCIELRNKIFSLEKQVKTLERALHTACVDLLILDGKSYLPESKEVGVAGQDIIIYEQLIKQATKELENEEE